MDLFSCYIYGLQKNDNNLVLAALNQGLDINGKFVYGGTYVTPICVAIMLEKWDVLKYIFKNIGKIREIEDAYPLMELTCLNNYTIDEIKLLIENGADINETNDIGFTPIFNVCYDGKLEIAKFMYDNGAKLKIRNYYGVNCLTNFLSGPNFSEEFLIWLLEKGEDAKNVDNDGDTIFSNMNQTCKKKYYNLLKDYVSDKINLNQVISILSRGKSVQSLESIIVADYTSINYRFNKIEDALKNGATINKNDQNINISESEICNLRSLIYSKNYEEVSHKCVYYLVRDFSNEEILTIYRDFLNTVGFTTQASRVNSLINVIHQNITEKRNEQEKIKKQSFFSTLFNRHKNLEPIPEKRIESVDVNKEYNFILVKFAGGRGKYWYIDDSNSKKIGDKLYITNQYGTQRAEVLERIKCTGKKAPYPIHSIKHL